MASQTVFGTSRESIESAIKDAVAQSSIDPEHLCGVVKRTLVVTATCGIEYWVEVDVRETGSGDDVA
jgi:flavin-binding protein dodecin